MMTSKKLLKGEVSLKMMAGRLKKIAVSWDFFNKKASNHNVVFVVESGSGKSIFTQEYMNAIRNLENSIRNTNEILPLNQHLKYQEQRGKRK